MNLAALLLAVLGTTFLMGLAGFVLHGKAVLDIGRTALRVSAIVPGPWGSFSFGLAVFGFVVGIPLSLGLIETSLFSLLAAPLCCMAGAWIMNGSGGQPLSGVAWFTVMAWCASIPFLIIGSFSANSPAAVQAVLGPLPMHQGPVRLGALTVGLMTGTVAASRWLFVLPGLVSTQAALIVRWGVAALAGTLLFGNIFGSGLAGIAYGVLDRRSIAWSATSVGASAVGVLTVTWLSQRMGRISDRYLFPVLALLAACASVAAVLG